MQVFPYRSPATIIEIMPIHLNPESQRKRRSGQDECWPFGQPNSSHRTQVSSSTRPPPIPSPTAAVCLGIHPLSNKDSYSQEAVAIDTSP